MNSKSGVKGRGSWWDERWWERRWWLWWGDACRMGWIRGEWTGWGCDGINPL